MSCLEPGKNFRQRSRKGKRQSHPLSEHAAFSTHRPLMETFPNERNKISLAHNEQQQNVPSDREQLLGTWETERLDCIQRKFPQSERELALGTQQHRRIHFTGKRRSLPRAGGGAGCPRNWTRLGVRLSSLSRRDKGGYDESDGAAGDAECVFSFSNAHSVRKERKKERKYVLPSLSLCSEKGCFKKERRKRKKKHPFLAVTRTGICTWLLGARPANEYWGVAQGVPSAPQSYFHQHDCPTLGSLQKIRPPLVYF